MCHLVDRMPLNSSKKTILPCLPVLYHFIRIISVIPLLTVAGNSELMFSVEPSDTIALEDRTTVLDCTIKGFAGRVDIEWKKDGQLLSFLSDQHRSILSNGSIYFSRVSHSGMGRSDQGLYQCVATVQGVGSIISRAAKFQITTLSGLEEPPHNQSVLQGQTARFSCSVQGVPPATVTWLKNQHLLHLDQTRMLVLPSGALEIDEVDVSDEGYYSCNASTINKYRLSLPSRLTVMTDLDISNKVTLPTFIAIPKKNLVALAGSTATLDCAANGIPRPWITWLKDGATIDMADLDSRFVKIGTGNLQINNILESDQGVYQCRAENREDSVDATTSLEIQVAPHFNKRPSDLYALEKDDVEFECEIYGNPEPTIQWVKNGDIIVVTDYFQIVNGHNLKILGLMPSDAGMYQCIGFNAAGNIQASARLQILQPGEAPPAKDVPSAPRNPAAVIVSTRFVTLSWREPAKTNGVILTYSVYYHQEGSQRERVVNTSRSRLEEANIQGLQPAKKYLLRVVAYNQYGPGASSEEIVVETQPEVHVPSPPLNFKARTISPTSIFIQWDPPENPNGQIQHYILYYMQGDSVEEHEVSTAETSLMLQELDEFTDYSIWVVADNPNGPGASTEEVVVRTFSDVPTDTPQNVTLEAASSTSIIIRWEPPPKEHLNGIITGYKIRYKRKGRRNKGDAVTTDGNRRLYALTSLDKGSEYQIRVSAMTVNGTGPSTEWHAAQTYENDLDEGQVPDPPSYLKARPMTDSISLSWNPPRNQNIMVRGYTIGWGKGIPDVYSKLVDGKQRYYVMEGLEPDSEYVISLRAYNQMGDGRPIYETVRTREETTPEPLTPLIPPVGLKAIVLSSSTVVLYWSDHTLPRNQLITDSRYYVVRYTSSLLSLNPRYKYYNATDLNCMIDDLKPNTQYEYTVKVVKGRRESPWSLVVTNATYEAAPATAPRDLTVVPIQGNPAHVRLNWQPPKQPNGQVTGYVIFYTVDNTKRDRDWVVEGIVGEKMSTVIRPLLPHTTYYFKIQARNSKGYGPLSHTISFTTLSGAGGIDAGQALMDGHKISNTALYIIVGCAAGIVFVLLMGGVYVICRRRTENEDRNRKGYMKGNVKGKAGKLDIKPPDLWIHHDQMELKALEKSQNSDTTLSVSPAATNSREFENEDKYQPSGSAVDKHTYMSSYVAPGGNQCESSSRKTVVKPKPIMIPVDAQPIKEPVATATPLPNGSLNQLLEGRPMYPRTQYNISRAHVTIDTSAQSPENPYGSHVMYDSIASGVVPPSQIGTNNFNQQPTCSVVVSGPSTPAVAANADSSGKRSLGHPLKSFSVPAPPPQSAPATPQTKHMGRTPQSGSTASPYKKGVVSTPSSSLKSRGPPLINITTGDENNDRVIQSSYSTEELNQEMANLEGLMKDLSAITASEFEC